MTRTQMIGIKPTCDRCGLEIPELHYVLSEENMQRVRTIPEAYKQAEIDLGAKGWTFQDGQSLCPACSERAAD